MKWPKPHFQEFPHCNPHWKQPWCGVTGWTNFSAIFLFLLSFLHDLATIGTVAGVSDNFLIFWAALMGGGWIAIWQNSFEHLFFLAGAFNWRTLKTWTCVALTFRFNQVLEKCIYPCLRWWLCKELTDWSHPSVTSQSGRPQRCRWTSCYFTQRPYPPGWFSFAW